MQALAFAQVDELPALLQVHSRGDLDGYVLTVLQRTLGYGEVVQPVSGYIDQVDVIAFAEFLIAGFARINGSFGQ